MLWPFPVQTFLHTFFFFFKDFIYFFLLERVEGREKERERNLVQEKHQSVASCMAPSRDLACNPGMCPDWESNQWHFGLQNDAQPTEPHQSTHCSCHFVFWFNFCITVACPEYHFSTKDNNISTLIWIINFCCYLQCSPTLGVVFAFLHQFHIFTSFSSIVRGLVPQKIPIYSLSILPYTPNSFRIAIPYYYEKQIRVQDLFAVLFFFNLIAYEVVCSQVTRTCPYHHPSIQGGYVIWTIVGSFVYVYISF